MSVNRLLANLAQSLDSSSVGSFLSGDSADRFQTLQWTDVSGRPTVADSATTTSLIDSAYVQSRVTTYTVGLDSATTIALLDSDYIRSKVTNDVGFFIYHYDTTAGQTLLDSSNEASNNAISYTKDYVMVFKNGVLLDSASGDYTAISGNTVVLGAAADSAELVTVVKWAPGSSSSNEEATIAWGGDRGLSGGGSTGSTSDVIDYVAIPILSNATDFGNLTVARYGHAGFSNGTRGVFSGGYSTTFDTTIDYVTTATAANATSFGSLQGSRVYTGGTGNTTYGITMGGEYGTNSTDVRSNYEYINTATTSNATSVSISLTRTSRPACVNNGTTAFFCGGGAETVYGAPNAYTNISFINIATQSNVSNHGSLIQTRGFLRGGVEDGTYGIIIGGLSSNGEATYINSIEYFNMSSLGNGVDFGDLLAASGSTDSTSNGVRAVCMGTRTNGATSAAIDTFVMATPGNASDFGDLTVARSHNACCSGRAS